MQKTKSFSKNDPIETLREKATPFQTNYLKKFDFRGRLPNQVIGRKCLLFTVELERVQTIGIP